MNFSWISTFDLGVAAHFAAQTAALIRVLLRADREPAVRAGWAVLIFTLPIVGIALYLLIGETRLNQRIARRQRDALARLPRPEATAPGPRISPGFHPAFARAASVSGYAVTGAPPAQLLSDPDDQIASLIAAIEAARTSVHLITYIWLGDVTGRAVAAALTRAAARGVAVRVLVDGLGGRAFLRSPEWRALGAAGAQTAVAFPFHLWLLKLMSSRVDLRNHRKLAVIDGEIAFLGSRNIADPEFRTKARFAPWIDVVARIEGTALVAQHQHVFATDWLTHTGEDLSALLDPGAAPLAPEPDGATAVAFATGPLLDTRGVPDVFLALIGAASESLTITSPYFVPGEAIVSALRAAAIRGVKVRLILPRHNDSRFVALASRSYFPTLTEAGVEIHAHGPGLLHAKTLLVDGRVALIGSANLDRRSFELNYENLLLLEDPAFAADLAALQAHWLSQSRHVDAARIARWPWPRRLIDNLIAILAPVL